MRQISGAAIAQFAAMTSTEAVIAVSTTVSLVSPSISVDYRGVVVVASSVLLFYGLAIAGFALLQRWAPVPSGAIAVSSAGERCAFVYMLHFILLLVGSLNELFVQGGGDICASLDITGAGFTVENCCLANAASGVPVMAEVCWEEPEVSIAMVPGNSTVPAGYTVRYLLASMPNGAILDSSATPEFAVDTLGCYTIHTIVYDTLTFSLSSINLDTTTVDEVTGAFISGSGALCGDVDFVGVAVQVVRCCPGAFGTVEFINDTLCHVPAGAAFTWSLNDADVPEGNTVLYPSPPAMGSSSTPHRLTRSHLLHLVRTTYIS